MNIQPDFVLLRRDLSAPLPTAEWPAGVTRAQLEAADAGAIHAVLQRAYSQGFGAVPADWLSWWEALLTDSEFDRDLCIVAKRDHQVVGFCLCWTSSFVKDLVVNSDWTGRGIGAALLASALKALRDRGAPEAQLKVVTGNADALRLYQRFGFS